MLGPALERLFTDLNDRQDKLTDYEKAVHGELEALKNAGRVAVNVAGAGEHLKGLIAGVGLPQEFDVTLKTQVDLGGGGWTGPPILQTSCKNPNCPNKVR